jgi:hypothetical protein
MFSVAPTPNLAVQGTLRDKAAQRPRPSAREKRKIMGASLICFACFPLGMNCLFH